MLSLCLYYGLYEVRSLCLYQLLVFKYEYFIFRSWSCFWTGYWLIFNFSVQQWIFAIPMHILWSLWSAQSSPIPNPCLKVHVFCFLFMIMLYWLLMNFQLVCRAVNICYPYVYTMVSLKCTAYAYTNSLSSSTCIFFFIYDHVVEPVTD